MTPGVERMLAIARKEFRHLARDPRILAAVLVTPVIQLLLFAYAISFDVTDVPTVVVDQDRTAASREYVSAYRSSAFFDVRGEATDLVAVDRLVDRGQARIVVVVPSGFARALARGDAAQVGVLVDGSEPNAARLGQSYAIALNQAYGQGLTVTWADRNGLDVTSAGRLDPRIRTWYNPERDSSIFLIPGLMVVIIMIVTTQQTAVTLVRERDQGTGEQMRVSPLRRTELMVGKLLPWTLLAFLDLLVITLVGRLVFGVPWRGDVVFFSVAAVVFVFCALAIGLIVSAVAPSIETANIVALLISLLPAFILSGFAFPLGSVPAVLQWISHLFPARYMVSISRGVFLKGGGFAEFWPELASLTAYALIALAVAVRLHARQDARLAGASR